MSTFTLYKYRVWCTTENAWVFTWNNSTPTTCPNNNTHTITSTSTTIVDSLTSAPATIPLTPFEEVRIADRTKLIELKSIFGKSTLRDIFTETNGGTVTNALGDSEFALAVTGSNAIAGLQSAERGRYVAGLQGEMGMAGRVPQTLIGNQVAKIGLFDTSNGLYFKATASNLYCCILRGGVETAIARNNWNYDKLDGTGPSNTTIADWSLGVIFIIQFTWYGYGNVMFKINTNSVGNVQRSMLVHTFSPVGMTSVQNPNLPLSATLANNGTNATSTMYVAGRQYSVLGGFDPVTRINSTYVLAKNVNSSTVFQPIISIRRKTGYTGNPVNHFEFDVSATTDLVIQIRTSVTLTGSAFSAPTDTSATNTAVEADSSATVMTGGILLWCGLITGDTKTTSNTDKMALSYNMTEQDILTFCAKGQTSTGTVNIAVRWKEEW
jgi:hypothetical protein